MYISNMTAATLDLVYCVLAGLSWILLFLLVRLTPQCYLQRDETLKSFFVSQDGVHYPS